MSKAKTELWHQILTHDLPLYFPETDKSHRSSRSDWLFAFLEQFPSPHVISAISEQAFIEAAWDVVGRKVSKERLLSDIYKTAQESVGCLVAQNSEAISMFRMILAQGRSLIEQRNTIEDKARAKSNEWRNNYNENRPHSSLGNRTLNEFALQINLQKFGRIWPKTEQQTLLKVGGKQIFRPP